MAIENVSSILSLLDLSFRRPVLVLLLGALERAQLRGPRDVFDDAVAGDGLAGRGVGVLHERQVPRPQLLHPQLQPIRILLRRRTVVT